MCEKPYHNEPGFEQVGEGEAERGGVVSRWGREVERGGVVSRWGREVERGGVVSRWGRGCEQVGEGE